MTLTSNGRTSPRKGMVGGGSGLSITNRCIKVDANVTGNGRLGATLRSCHRFMRGVFSGSALHVGVCRSVFGARTARGSRNRAMG